MSEKGWQAVGEIIGDQDPHCCGVLLLGLDAPMDQVKESFSLAAKHRHCKGFTVGRTLFARPLPGMVSGAVE